MRRSRRPGGPEEAPRPPLARMTGRGGSGDVARRPWTGTRREQDAVLAAFSPSHRATPSRGAFRAHTHAGPARGARRRADHRRGTSLQPPPDHPRRRDDRAEAAEERQGARDRRRRPRQPGAALPGRRRRRHDRHRGVRRGRRVEPAAPDHPRPVRHRQVQGAVGQGVDRRGQPVRRGGPPRGAARQRQRHGGLRGLRPDRRRHRQLRDPLHGQRRGVLPRDPLRLGLDLPLRRPGVGVRAHARPTTRPATAASTPSPRRRAWSRAAPRAACWACCARASARSRSTRRSSCSPASATRWSAS